MVDYQPVFGSANHARRFVFEMLFPEIFPLFRREERFLFLFRFRFLFLRRHSSVLLSIISYMKKGPVSFNRAVHSNKKETNIYNRYIYILPRFEIFEIIFVCVCFEVLVEPIFVFFAPICFHFCFPLRRRLELVYSVCYFSQQRFV